MSLNAPALYIAGSGYAGTATAPRPPLAGATITWGGDSHTDFDGPATLSCEVLVKAGQSFTAGNGSVVAMLDDTGRTFFAGRITALTSRRDKRLAGAHIMRISAADTLADLAKYRRNDLYWPASTAYTTTAATRRAQLAAAMPPGWTLEAAYTAYDWTYARQERWLGKELLPIIDMHLRSALSRRHVTTTYDPAAGLSHRLTISRERAKGGAHTGATIVRVPASNITTELEWEKNPGDTVTDVKLTSFGLTYDKDPATDPEAESSSTDLWTMTAFEVDTAAVQNMQNAYGVHQLAFDVDTLGGSSVNPHIGQLVNYWLEADTKWRPTSLPVADSALLADATVRDLLDVTKRGMAYAILDELPPNPSGYGRVESYITGGKATWTGSKWALDLTLGRQTVAAGTPIGA